MDIQCVGCGGMDRIVLTQNREGWWALVNAVMNLPVSYTEGSFWTSWGTVSFSSRTPLHGVTLEGLQPASPRPLCVRPCLTVRPAEYNGAFNQLRILSCWWFESAVRCWQLIPRHQLRARNDSSHGCSASTHVVCCMTVTASADTVKWHSLCTCICVYGCMYACNVCMYVRMRVMYVCMYWFIYM
jgi:hypothetical protein